MNILVLVIHFIKGEISLAMKNEPEENWWLYWGSLIHACFSIISYMFIHALFTLPNIQCSASMYDYLIPMTFLYTVICLKGETGKMSASDPNSAIYVTDSSKDIKNKVCMLILRNCFIHSAC